MKITLVNLVLFCGLLVGHLQPIWSESVTAVQIVSIVDHTFRIDSKAVESILGNDRIKDRHVVIFSIAGSLRKGKSFFLNFPLKHLRAKYVRHDISDWIGENEIGGNELHGFKWRGGQKPETTGIWMWPEIFTHDYENGDKVAIILLDTQGIYDHESSIKDCTATFAISMMISSVQCYNVMQYVQEDNLQNLDFFTQYGQLAMEQTNEKPFQNLLFLVRDWPYADENDYGYAPKYVEKILAGSTKQTPDMKQLRDRIKSSFQEINAFLMPYPGTAVAEGKNTNGILSEIDPKFIKYVKEIVPSIFAPENLTVKRINGQKLRAHDVVTYLETYIKTFNGNELPEPKTAWMATAEASIVILYNECFKSYVETMRNFMEHQSGYTSSSTLLEHHEKARDKSVLQFQNKRKLGSHELISSYMSKLEKEITNEYQSYERENKNKQKISEDRERLRKENERQQLELKTLYGEINKPKEGFSAFGWLDLSARAATAAAACGTIGTPVAGAVCSLLGVASKLWF